MRPPIAVKLYISIGIGAFNSAKIGDKIVTNLAITLLIPNAVPVS